VGRGEARRSEDLRRGIEAKTQQRPGARGFGNQGSRVCVGVSLFFFFVTVAFSSVLDDSNI
jgi:hypothetical protein